MRSGAVALVLLAACASRKAPPLPGYVRITPAPPFRPPEPVGKNWDWVQLTSDEWLKGEIEYMRNHSLEIDSDELGILDFSWRKVKTLRSPREMSVLLDNQATLRGPLAMKDGEVVVKRDDGFAVFPRPHLVTLVPGGRDEWSLWSGDLGIGATLRTGNTDQLDASLGFGLRRRAPESRLQIDYLGNYSKVNGEETASNQRLTGRYDLTLSRRWFATPLAVEAYRDPFQNIDARVTPLAGAGYFIYKKGIGQDRIDWDVSALAGYRFTKFRSGEDGTVTAGFTTSVEWDVSAKLDFEFRYDVQMSVEDPQNTNQNLTLTLEWDLWRDFDLEFSYVLNYVGQPQADEDGDVPKKTDSRFTFGLGWDF